MIDLPAEAIINSIKTPCICHFKDTNFLEDAPPHFYIVIPVNDCSDLIFCIITSKVEKRIKYYNKVNPKAAKSLVEINPNKFHFLNRKSVIDCNRVELIPKNIFKKRIDASQNLIIKLPSIKNTLLEAIKKGISNSPLIAPAIKNLI